MNIQCIHIVYDEMQNYYHDVDENLSLKTKKSRKNVENYCIYGHIVGFYDMTNLEAECNLHKFDCHDKGRCNDPDDFNYYVMGNLACDLEVLRCHEESERNSCYYSLAHKYCDDYVQRAMIRL